MSSGNLEPNDENDEIVTQNSIDAHQVTETDDKDQKDWATIKSKSASREDDTNKIEKKETTLKDNDPANNENENNEENFDIGKIQERIRKQSAHLREIGDQVTMREIGVLDEHEKQLSAQRYTPQPHVQGSFLGDELRQTDSIIRITPTSSFLVRHDNITTILIDEFDNASDVKDLETIEVSLPRSPMAALILMESVGLWHELDKFTQASIYCAIILTTAIQYVAAGTLYFQKFFGDYEVTYGSGIDGLFNLIVMAFVVVYLAQDAARLYKMYILLKHVTTKTKTSTLGGSPQNEAVTAAGGSSNPISKSPSAAAAGDIEMGRTDNPQAPTKKKLKRRDIGFLYIFIFSNILFYIFLLYYAMIETLQRDSLSLKLQVAISVFFVLELDDWLYNVTIEPLKVLEDSVFELRIRGNKGSKKKRFRRISSYFWGSFFFVQIMITLLFVTKSFERIKL